MTSYTAYLQHSYYEDFYPGISLWYPGEMGDDDPIPDKYRSLVRPRLPASFYAVTSPILYPGPIDETSMDGNGYDLSPEDDSAPFQNTYNEAPENSSTLYQNTYNASLEIGSTSHQNAYNGTPGSSFTSYQNTHTESPEDVSNPYENTYNEAPDTSSTLYQNTYNASLEYGSTSHQNAYNGTPGSSFTSYQNTHTESPEDVSNPYENTYNEDTDNWSTSNLISRESHGYLSNPYEYVDNEAIESGHIQYGNLQNQGLENRSIPNIHLYQPPDNAYSQYQGLHNQPSHNLYTTIGTSYNESVSYEQAYSGGVVSHPDSNNSGPTFNEVRETIKQDIYNTDHSEADTMINGPMYPDVGYDMARNIANDIKPESIKAHVHFNSWTAKFEIRKVTNISESIGVWFRQYMDRACLRQLFTQSEFTQLEILEGELTKGFAQPYYHRSVKQPFLQVRTRGQEMPRIVIEIGWNESIQRMSEDVFLWGDGSYSTVRVVILVHFTRHPDKRVQCSLEVWRPQIIEVPDNGAVEYHRDGMQLVQVESIFPIPPSRQRDTAIRLTRGELFGSAMAPGRDSKDVFEFYMNELQDLVETEVRAKGLVPLENGQTNPGDGEN
ncbi:uncharacterized protein LDX57_002699 [Aspergillus melleus]|uniref:uncharacterized protein n=1 Tax=Aspergillus melleus TaxID=138277 RepID=UPI001E8E177F|nr:uncharacterized protein LDX57_002699 [Aspergillus melleus]KAH8424953.1 hypothetical protein LDX57_002699 [Aspergillus melleus]